MKKILLFISLISCFSVFSQEFLIENGTVNTCSGTFLDSGGAAGNYGSNESFVYTICPDNPGQFLEFTFTEWSTQLNADTMTIYNGPDTASPAFGIYSGGATGSPGLVVATQANPSGCITFQFTSDAAATTTGWAATINCFEPCQTITSQIDSTSPAPNGDGYIRVCTDEEITLTGSGQFSNSGIGATYEWDLGNNTTIAGQTATFSYPNPGVYIVNLNITDTNPLGCSNTNLVNQVIQVDTSPDFTGTMADDDTLCFESNTTNITGVVNPVDFINDCTPPVSGTTFLPDGSGASYTTCITVDCYESSQTLDDISQLIEICLNMEHSYLGDLDIFITSPNGQQVTLKSFGAGGGGIYLGGANDDNGLDPGVGADYCFAMSGTVILVNGPTIIAGSNPAGNSIAPGTYLPEESYAGLLGSPLNGDWCIEVVDNLGIDNGYIFSWGMNFDPSIQPPELSFTPVITSEAWDADPTIINTAGNVITVQPTTAGTHCYTYRVTDDFGCEYTEEVCIELYPEIVNDPPSDLFVCDTGAPPYIFDLTQNEGLVLASNPNPGDYQVSFHETQADADADTNAIGTAAAYSGTDGQIIYVRIDYLTTDCWITSTFTLNVSGQPIINAVPDLEICDDISNDGFGEFDLETQSLGILGIQDPIDFVVTYYTSFVDADAGTNALVSPFTNTVNPQSIFARVESVGDSNCFIASANAVFDLIVNPQATANQPDDMSLCDDVSNDEIEQFDLESQTSAILGGQAPADYLVTYHLSQAEADSGLNALFSPYMNISNPQTIYVHVEELANPSCYGTTSFELIVDPLPSLIAPTPLEVCDDGVADGLTSIDLSVKDDEIRGGNSNYAITYYLTQADADAAMNQLSIPYTNISNPQLIYVRGQDINTGCYSTTTLELIVEQAPLANLPTPLEYCDPDSDGFGVFTLSDSDDDITGGLPGLTVSYHETLADAQNNVNALTSPYNNIVVNTQTLYARVESATITTDCYTIVELALIVHPDPQITTADGLEACDDNTDGFTQFDLTQVSTQVLNGIDPGEVTISYYETQANAEAGTNAILVPSSYTNITNPQTVWIRVEYVATGCYKVTSFTLTVNELPVLAQPIPLELCDVNAPGDEMESFTLEDSILEILNGQTGLSITFYETQVDADLGVNAIVSPYTNLTNPQTVYARAENDVTACVSTITLDLRVNPIPSPVVPTAQEVCDDDNDGFSSFDLESSTVEIINGELDISISYHETQGDAEQGVNALVSPYDNIVPTLQTVYARAENGFTGCFTIVELDLNVLSSPEIPLLMDDHVVCDDDDDGFTGFDLSEMDSVILGTQDASLFILSYHLTQGDADVGANPIVNVTNYTNMTNPQTLYVRLESIVNGCVSTGSFDIRVELPPVPLQPTPLEECDDEIADEITVFDLTVKDGEITGGNGSWSVSYYLTDADAQGDVNVIDPATSYTNTAVGVNPANPQTLYVRVTDTDTGCFAFTTLTLRVLPNPTPSVDPSDIELCDDTNTGDTQEEFDLTLNQGYIINGEAGVSATYHESLEDAHGGVNAIVDPTQYTNTSVTQTIWVRVTNDLTGCYTLVSFDIIVNPLPEVIAVTDYIVCEVDTDGFWSFDLESKTEEVLNGQDALEYAVSYHFTQGDAELGINALVSPYTNITNPQQIFVNITNTLTGCDIATVSFNIEVQQGAEANSDGEAIVYVLCDDNMETDGDPSNDSVQFDLTVQDGALLDGQDPLNYTVSYYESLSDAELGFNPLPTLYENSSNPQQIYARVDNDTTLDSICYAVTDLTLMVEPLPVFDLEETFVLCVDTNGTEIIDPPLIDTGLSEVDYSFIWQLNGVDLVGTTGSSLSPTEGGSYSVIVMDNVTGCQNTDTVVVNESSPPIVTAQVSSLAFAEDHVVEAIATGPGEYEYSLDDGPWQSSGTFTGVSAGEHVVTARDINGCGIATTTVLVIDYPLYFTPNGDGYHDTWNIVGIATQPNAKIYIFDRYGKLLKQLSPTGEGWNGTYNGAPLPSNDYWFTVVYDEPSSAVKKEFKAHFTLKR